MLFSLPEALRPHPVDCLLVLQISTQGHPSLQSFSRSPDWAQSPACAFTEPLLDAVSASNLYLSRRSGPAVPGSVAASVLLPGTREVPYE